MKKLGLLLCFIFFVGTGFAQDAQSYLDKGVEYYNAKNYSQAIPYFKKANELAGGNNSACQFNIGHCYNLIGNYTQAVDWYRKAAEQGVAEAQYLLGACYANAQGVTEDDAQAVYWYRKAAEQGYANAQFKLGYAYHFGQGVTKDEAQVVYWYRKAAEQGYGDAQGMLSLSYYWGWGTAQDLDQAKYWGRKAVAQEGLNTVIKGLIESSVLK